MTHTIEMTRVDPKIDIANFLSWVYSKNPNKPIPKVRVNFKTGKDLTFEDFYVPQYMLDASHVPCM